MTIKKDATDKYDDIFCCFDFAKNQNAPESFLKMVRGDGGSGKNNFTKMFFPLPP